MALALAQAAPATSPPSPAPMEDVVGRWDDERIAGAFARAVDPHLTGAERRTLQSIEFQILAGPAPAEHACRPLARFAAAERRRGAARVTLCLRNVILFGVYSTNVAMSMMMNQRYWSDEDLIAYARVVALGYTRVREERDFAIRRFRCLLPEYVPS